MIETKKQITLITEAIQEKKGQNIVIVDLTTIDDTICEYMVICEGSSPNQVRAVAESVGDSLRTNANERPIHVAGVENAEWIAMDYSDITVHIFLPESRTYYNLETLWADAKLTRLPAID